MSESSNCTSLHTEISGKVVLVTGASSGIGKATAIEFAKNNCRLAISGRNKDNLNATAIECAKFIKDAANDIIEIIADLEIEADCSRVVDETIAKYGQLDIIVNSAGIITSGTLEELSIADYDKQMNINTRSVFITLKAAIPHLKKTKGNIVNVSSVTGLRSFPSIMSYCMSKAALDQLTRCLALELGPNVRVNAVNPGVFLGLPKRIFSEIIANTAFKIFFLSNPGVIVTDVHRRGGMNDEQYQQFIERSKSTHALQRVGNPEEVAKSIVFLSSDKLAGFMTGVTLSIDGGRGIMCPR